MSAEKESVRSTANFDKCSIVLVDVLGTTTSINFAEETLFPYVIKNVEDVLKAKWEDESVKTAVKQLKEEELDLEATVKLVKELTDSKSENAGLKAIQGIVYEKGYESGDLKAHVYSDVPKSLENWAKSRKVAVYSTGSISSQKQLFTHSIEGNLTTYISNYFDLSVGPKTEAKSYTKIAEELSVKPEEIVFVTDLIEEAKAAKSAGVSAVLISRDEDTKLSDAKEFAVVKSLQDILFENSSKRKKLEEAVNEEPPSKLAKTESNGDLKEEIEAEKTEAENKIENENVKKVEDEAMEVDASPEEKSAEKEKSETLETTEKTEEKEKTDEPVEDESMADSTVNDKKTAEKEEKTEKNNDVVDDTATEKTLKESEDNKMDSKDDSEKDQSVAETKVNDEVTGDKEMNIDEKEVKSESEGKEATVESKEQETKSESKEKKAKPQSKEDDEVDSTSKEGKEELVEKNTEIGESDIKEDKVDSTDNTTASETIMATDDKEKKTTEKSTESDTAESNEAKPAEPVKEIVVEVSEEKDDSKKSKTDTKDESTAKSNDKPEETKETTKTESEVTSTEDKVESTCAEESSETKCEEEKENKPDLANGLEKVEKDGPESNKAANGETEEKSKINGDSKSQDESNGKLDEPSTEKVEEIKVKKAEVSPATSEAPAVSVEV